MRAGGGETAWKARLAFGYSVGGSVMDGLLLGVPLILLTELLDNLETPETLVSVDLLRECSPSNSADLDNSVMPRLIGLEMGGKPFLNAISRAEEADVCCEIDRGDFFGS